MSRPISDAWFHRIKSATRDIVKACGGVVRAGEIASTSKTEVSRWQSATDPDVISLTATLALEADCGLPLITAVMADLNGRSLSDPDAEFANAQNFVQSQADTLRASANMMVESAKALADGKITPSEAEVLDRHAADIERNIAPMRRDLAVLKGKASTTK